MNKNSLLKISDLSKKEIEKILDDANVFGEKYRDWQLPERKLIANLFFESSTRTHYSFASAQHQLGCIVENFSKVGSSVEKGESLYDTVKTFQAIGFDALVIRHKENEYFNQLSNIDIPILNGGDGSGNHPTQCLLDMLTIYQEFGTLEGIKIAIIGDILHSRVAASNKEAIEMLGGSCVFSGPKQWMRKGYTYEDIDQAVSSSDVVMMLRVQNERHSEEQRIDTSNYLEEYGLNKQRYNMMKKDAILMHPAPINRGVELDTDLVEAEKSRIFKQMSNGVSVRKAVIKRAFGYEFE